MKSKTYEDAVSVVEQLLETDLNESETVSIDVLLPMTLEQNDSISTVKIFTSNNQLVTSNDAGARSTR